MIDRMTFAEIKEMAFSDQLCMSEVWIDNVRRLIAVAEAAAEFKGTARECVGLADEYAVAEASLQVALAALVSR